MPRASPAWFIMAVVCLCLLTPYPWVASRAMPDIFTPLAILSVFLLLFGGADRPRIRRGILLSVILASVSFHKSNILVVGGIVPLLVILAYARRFESRPKPQIICLIVAVVLLGIGMDRAISALRGGYTDLPYMVAQLVSDGPAKLYLQETCPEHHYLLCDSSDRLPSDSDEFLFHSSKYLDDVSRPARLRLRQEEWPIVVGTVTAHPIYVLRVVAANLGRLFITFDLNDYRNYPEFAESLPAGLPTDYSQVAASRQVNDRLGLPVFTATNAIAMVLSIIVLLIIWCVSRPSELRLNWLAITIVLGILINGLVAGALAGPFPRLQARVVWLLPFLAYLACAFICERHTKWRRDLARSSA